MNRARFEALVRRAIASIPAEFQPHLDGLRFVVEDWPAADLLASLGMDGADDTLLGFYDGVPLTERGFDADGGADTGGADTVYVFQGPLEEMCRSDRELVEQIRITVIHEVGHHFGLDDDAIDRLGFG